MKENDKKEKNIEIDRETKLKKRKGECQNKLEKNEDKEHWKKAY